MSKLIHISRRGILGGLLGLALALPAQAQKYSTTFGASGGGNGPFIPTLVTTFTSSGTWTKNPATKLVRIYAMGGGGGGGGGAMGTSGTNVSGGASGAPGGVRDTGFLPAALFTSPAAVVITSSGVGGLGATVNGPGAIGTVGGNASIAVFSNPLVAYGGGCGGGGLAGGLSSAGGSGASDLSAGLCGSTAVTVGTAQYWQGQPGIAGATGTINGNTAGGGASGSGSSSTTGQSGIGTILQSGGCGAGAPILAAPTAVVGGAGGGVTANPGTISAGGTVGGGAGGNSPAAVGGFTTPGAGGGGSNITGVGGAGGSGAGQFGTCGGGGGAGTSGGGAGGAGGSPMVVVMEVF